MYVHIYVGIGFYMLCMPLESVSGAAPPLTLHH